MIAVPIFWRRELYGFACVAAHLLDIGGAFPGISADAFDVYAEGKLYNGLRWYRAGVLNQDLDRMIFDNVRTETMNRGDCEAMLASCQLGRARFLRLVERYGAETVMSAGYEWMDYSERMLRQEIAKIPDGQYSAPTGWLDDDGRNRDVPLRIETKVVIEGDEITVDMTGSNPEVATSCNVPFEGSLCVGVYYGVRAMLLDEAIFPERVPQNDGVFRPITVVAPKGTIFNPSFPRSCNCRFVQVQRVVDNMNLALTEALPEKTTAGNSASLHGCAYGGFDPKLGQYWIHIEINEGCYGGRNGKDAMDSVDNLMANTRNTPIEEVEMRFPLPLRAVRAAAGTGCSRPLARRHWDHPAQPLPRRWSILMRGRPPIRPTAGRLRWLGRTRRLLPQKSRHRARAVPSGEGGRYSLRRRRVHRVPRAERGRVRRPATARPRTRAPRLARRLHYARTCPRGIWVVFRSEGDLAVDREATGRLRDELRATRRVSSLTEHLKGKEPGPAPAPATSAGNKQFGII